MKFNFTGISDDYASATIGTKTYYYGYEVVYCTKCKEFYDCCDTCDCDSDNFEWAFEVKDKDNNKDYMRVEDYDWEDMAQTLLELIARYNKE